MLQEVEQKPIKPRWKYVRDTLIKKIRREEMKVDELIPSLEDLCTAFSVSPITVRRALREMTDMGYIVRKRGVGSFVVDRNPRRQSVGGGASILHHIGLLYPSDKNAGLQSESPFYLNIVTNLYAEINARKGDVLYFNLCLKDEQPLAPVTRAFKEDRIQAIVLMGLFTERILHAVEELDVPAVQMDYMSDNSTLDAVILDNAGGGRRLVEMLWTLGHRRFGLVKSLILNRNGDNPRLVESLGSRGRSVGALEALRELGVEPRPEHVIEGELGEYDWVPEIERMLSGPESPTAIIATTKVFVPEISRIAAGLGMRVPEDLALATFGSRNETAEIRPKPFLATFEIETFAEAIIDRLLARYADAFSPQVIRKIPMNVELGEGIRFWNDEK